MMKRSLTLRRYRLPRGLELAGRESRRLEDKRRELPVLRVRRRLEAPVPVLRLAPRGLGATGSWERRAISSGNWSTRSTLPRRC